MLVLALVVMVVVVVVVMVTMVLVRGSCGRLHSDLSVTVAGDGDRRRW